MRIGKIQKKILLLLMGGLSLGLSGSPRQSFRIIKIIGNEWRKINQGKNFKRSIKALYDSKLVKIKKRKNGTIIIVLTEKGKELALKYDMEKMRIKPVAKWDGKWRVVIFDIPEKQKGRRDALRFCLKKLNFYELQKSVWIFPFDCQKEIQRLTQVFEIEKFVNYMQVDFIDNNNVIKKHFKTNENVGLK